MKTDSSRREFCARTCQLVAIAAVEAALPACSGGGNGVTGPSGQSLPTLNATSGTGGATLTIDSGSPLASVGGAALVQTSRALLLVARTSADTFSALNSTCTHERCTITGYTGDEFVCPCHGSHFDQGGRALTGPARTALRSFPTSFAGGVLTISV